MIKRWIPTLLACLIVGTVSFAYTADQGKPTTQGNAWPVLTAPRVCNSPTHKVTSVGVAASNTPSSQLTNRTLIILCNSSENTGTPLVKCRIDGTNPTMGVANVGDVLKVGDCVTYSIATAVVPKCISDTAATAVTSIECI